MVTKTQEDMLAEAMTHQSLAHVLQRDRDILLRNNRKLHGWHPWFVRASMALRHALIRFEARMVRRRVFGR